MTLFEQITAIATARKPEGYLRHYEADLTTHDKAVLDTADPAARFLWVLRDCGTNIFEIASGRDHAWVTYWLNQGNGTPRALVYLLEGGTVRQIDYATAEALARVPHPDGKRLTFRLS